MSRAEAEYVSEAERAHPDSGCGTGWTQTTTREAAERGLAALVLTIVELLRQLMERQALRRVEDGTVTDEQAERLGYHADAPRRADERADRASSASSREDLNIDLGPLGPLLDS